MPSLSDIRELLRGWAVWKKIEELPSRMDALEQRVAGLEQRLSRAPGEACPSCGALELRVVESVPSKTFEALGIRDHKLRCGACGFEDVRQTG
jgi:hypothetical protein